MSQMDREVGDLNRELLKYCSEIKLDTFDRIFQSVKRRYRKAFRSTITGGSWWEIGKPPGCKGPLPVTSMYGANVGYNGWIVGKDSYFFSTENSYQKTPIMLVLFVYIDHDGKSYLAWNSLGGHPIVKFRIKDKALDAKVAKFHKSAYPVRQHD